MAVVCLNAQIASGGVGSARQLGINCFSPLSRQVPAKVGATRSPAHNIEGGLDGSPSFSRRESILGGFNVLIGASGVNLLCNPTVGAAEAKKTNLSIEDLKKIIEDDITQRRYLLTGNVTKSIYDDNCRFKDPTVDFKGLTRYIAALQSLFDPAASQLELLNSGVTGPRTVQTVWRLNGYMKLPWRPYIPPYEGTTNYTVDENGLIVSHSETWNVSPVTAFIEMFTPPWLSKDKPQDIS